MNIAAIDNKAASSNVNEVKAKAAELISNVFYGTLMKEFRQSSEGGLFSGGFAGQAFQQQLDNVFIGELSKQENNQIIDAMVRQLTNKGSRTSGVLAQKQLDARQMADSAIINKPAITLPNN
ncbi:MAG: rod-binding protein [Sedimentisphaerales bacterium]|nr:rod-binding protein [Sedimentisphaerales bacterium]MBN2843049.1 rod-binding protein [Sedimentisphaerales bacterium]